MNQKQKVILATSLATIIFLLTATGYFFSHYELKFQSPITIKLATPMYWIHRAMAMNITVVQEGQQHNTPLTPDQQYACDVFGPACKTFLAIAHAENGTGQCDRINWSNKDQSLDIGFAMVNTLWVNKNLVTPEQLFNCHTNIDFAYKIYKANGDSFKDWTTFNSGIYLKYMY